MITDDECSLLQTRLIPARPEEILAAVRDPERLARWWGPAGFRNTIHAFDFRPGGEWQITMHGPDGTDYPNQWKFEEIDAHRVVMRHLGPVHAFTLTLSFEGEGAHTKVGWKMVFDTPEECARVRAYAPRCNEENLDRLETELQSP